MKNKQVCYWRNKKLAKQILKMAKLDQQVRKAYEKNSSLIKKVKAVDKTNLLKMKKIIKKFGWPTVSLVGKKASHLAWLLVQHADDDVEFQESCLRLMKRAVEDAGVLKTEIAFLTDRILVNKGKPQIYGTQFYKNKAGKFGPRPIRNIETIDERRKSVGLGNFKIYKKKMEKAMI